MPQRLKDRGSYLTYETSSIADSLGSLSSILFDVLKQKDLKEQRRAQITDQIRDMKLKISAMAPEQQEYLKQHAPDLWTMFSDQDIESHAGKPHKGEIIPAPVRKLTEAEVFERRKKVADTKTVEEDVRKKEYYNKLRESNDPIERARGLKEGALSIDESIAAMVPEHVRTQYAAKTPGTPEYAKAEFSSKFQYFTEKVNPQSPKDVKTVRDWAAYFSGLSPEEPKTPLPKTLEGERIELERKRHELAVKTENRQAQEQVFQHRKAVNELSGTFATRLLQSGLKPEEASVKGMEAAIAYYKTGKVPADIPADIKPKLEADLAALQANQARENLRMAAQESPELKTLLDMIPKAPEDQREALGMRAVELYEKQFGRPKTDTGSRSLMSLTVPGLVVTWLVNPENRKWLASEVSKGLEDVAGQRSLRFTGVPTGSPFGAQPNIPAKTEPVPPIARENFDNLDPIKKQTMERSIGYVEMIIETGTVQQRERAREWIAKARLFQEGKLSYEDLLKELP